MFWEELNTFLHSYYGCWSNNTYTFPHGLWLDCRGLGRRAGDFPSKFTYLQPLETGAGVFWDFAPQPTLHEKATNSKILNLFHPSTGEECWMLELLLLDMFKPASSHMPPPHQKEMFEALTYRLYIRVWVDFNTTPTIKGHPLPSFYYSDEHCFSSTWTSQANGS